MRYSPNIDILTFLEIFMARPPFRTVWHLWIEPDFSRIESGELPPPYVNQIRFDFTRLQSLLSDYFVHEGVGLRVPNDTIDILTFQGRMDVEGLDIRFQDLAKRLRLEARKQTGPVIDVGKIWASRLSAPDRRVVPPPMVLPMVVETSDYEEMIHLRFNLLMRLGIIKEHPMDAFISAAMGEGADHLANDQKVQDEADSQTGELPEFLREAFGDMFGVAYHPKVMLDTAATDPLPAWAKRLD
jgi:hypothetical protein